MAKNRPAGPGREWRSHIWEEAFGFLQEKCIFLAREIQIWAWWSLSQHGSSNELTAESFASSAYVPSPAIRIAAGGLKRQQNQTSSWSPTAEGHLVVELGPWGAGFRSRTWEQTARPLQSCQITMYSQFPFLEALCQERSISTLDESLISVLQCRILPWPLWVHRNSTGLTDGQSLVSNKVLYLISNHLM